MAGALWILVIMVLGIVGAILGTLIFGKDDMPTEVEK
jgi:uncharacterized membrane protein YeaQ/YmgE (transglycosylase-associated protein family)